MSLRPRGTAAKVALYGAAASSLEDEAAAKLHVGQDYELAAPSAGAFDVPQQQAPGAPPLGSEDGA